MLYNLEGTFVNQVAQFSKASDPSQNESLKKEKKKSVAQQDFIT